MIQTQNKIKARKKNHGFTIVELLVVIVVIAILAAITIVSYTGITNRAKASQSASNANSTTSVAETYFAECGAYPSIAQLSSGLCPDGTTSVSTKLPTGLTAVTSSSGALTTSNFDKTVIYVLESTTGACIANYDPTYTTAVSPHYTNIKVIMVGSATTGFSANPNAGVATCS